MRFLFFEHIIIIITMRKFYLYEVSQEILSKICFYPIKRFFSQFSQIYLLLFFIIKRISMSNFFIYSQSTLIQFNLLQQATLSIITISRSY